MKQMLRNLLVCWLCLMVSALLPLTAQADEATGFAENSGSSPMVQDHNPEVLTVDPTLPSHAPASEATSKAEATNTFDIMEFRVLGNTVLPAEKIEAAVYPYLGERRTIEDAEAARTALEKSYHEAGYLTVLVNIPEQKVDGGIVKLEVTESSVDRVRVTGSRYYTLGSIKASVPELAEGKTPHFPTMQKQLAALNRSPDRRVTPVMKAGKTPGTLGVELKVEDKLPLHGSIGINDRYSADTSRWRTSMNVHYDNLWQLQHSISLTWLTAPENTNESKVFAGTYSVPLESGDYLALYAVHSESDVAAVNTLNVIGNGDIAGLRYIHPLKGLDNFYHNLTLGVDYKRFGQTVNLQGGDSFNTPVSYLPFLANWDGVWSGKSSTTKLGFNLNNHFRDLGGQESEFANKRFKAHANYVSLRSNIEQSWRFDNGSKFEARFNGQLTDQPLISNEQFAIGGADTVRGYLESEVLGDKGYVASLEVHTPSIGRRINSNISDLHALAFVDAGEVVTLEPLPSQRAHAGLASTGVGIRLNVRGLNAMFDFARALKDGATTRTMAGDNRWHVSVEYTF